MSDYPPQLGAIPHTSELQVPTLSSSFDRQETTSPKGLSGANGSTTANDAKSTLANARDTVTASMVSIRIGLMLISD